MIDEYPVEKWHGGKVRHIVRDKVILLERGQVFDIEGKRYLYPLTYSAPLILMWLMYTAGFKNKDKDTYEVNDSYNNHHE